jgi:hypothetical protein
LAYYKGAFVCSFSGAPAILCLLILQTIHVPMTWGETLLYVSSVFLTTMNYNNSHDCWYFQTDVKVLRRTLPNVAL